MVKKKKKINLLNVMSVIFKSMERLKLLLGHFYKKLLKKIVLKFYYLIVQIGKLEMKLLLQVLILIQHMLKLELLQKLPKMEVIF